MPLVSLAFSVLLASAASASPDVSDTVPPAPVNRSALPDIVVTAPEEDAQVIPIGSRIARDREDRGYKQVASDSGVQGLTPGSGMDPFAGPTRYVEVKECRSSDPALGENAACALALASKRMEQGLWDEARLVLYRLTENPALTPAERYVAARFFYRIALVEEDDLGRAEALEEMLATGAMEESDAVAARKTLVALALNRRDDAAAVGYLEMLLEAHPDDSRSQANLAALYARTGSHDRALPHMEKAVALAEQAGLTVLGSWTAYLQEHRR